MGDNELEQECDRLDEETGKWRARAKRLERELEEAMRELEFYRSLTISRIEDITSIDGGETAEKLHDLWESRDQYREALLRQKEWHDEMRKYGVPGDVIDKARIDIDAALQSKETKSG